MPRLVVLVVVVVVHKVVRHDGSSKVGRNKKVKNTCGRDAINISAFGAVTHAVNSGFGKKRKVS